MHESRYTKDRCGRRGILQTCVAGGLALPATVALALFLVPMSVTTQGQQQISRTAVLVACARAFMARDSDAKTRNPDDLVERLLDAELTSLVPEVCGDLQRPFEEAYPKRLQQPGGFQTLAVTARTKHIDAAVEASVARGVTQVVILGAGFDTRAYRMVEPSDGVRFFEVDSLATQEDKKQRVRRLFGDLPQHVVYVPIDFETQSLQAELAKAGFDEGAPVFYVWEGVTMYLTAAAVDATLQSVTQHSAAGSSIIFDYVLASLIAGTGPEPAAAKAARTERLARFGEPWLFGIPEGGIRTFVERRGFELVSDLGLPELFERYIGRDIPDSFSRPFMAAFRMTIARVHR